MERPIKRALALGSATSYWADTAAALELGEFDLVVAANEAGVLWSGQLDSWVSLHPNEMPGRIARREANGWPPAKEIVSHFTKQKKEAITLQVEYFLPKQRKSGSSGLFAVKRALDLGATHVVCCGIPISGELGRVDGKDVWPSARLFRQGWEEALPVIRDRVRSMSGWTRQLLGAPTADWLQLRSVEVAEGRPGRKVREGDVNAS